LGLAPEPPHRLRIAGHVFGQDLHGDRPIEHEVGSAMDPSHPALTEEGLDPVSVREQPKLGGRSTHRSFG
jgi:hypothetical protein